MPAKQRKISPGPVEIHAPPAAQDEVDYPTKTTTGRQDFVFAVKLFGIAALVVLAFWWLNRIV
jgi:hypothetical protein